MQNHEDTAIKVVITGGAGYIGWCLTKELANNGYTDIVYFDQNLSQPYHLDVPVSRLQGDVRDLDALKSAFKGATVVFHLASYGMTGYASLSAKQTMSVNVLGTRNVIKACIDCSIPYLIYSSTINVVFGGQQIIHGDETLPYFPIGKHVDEYSKSKTIAEMLVLNSNGMNLHGVGIMGENVLRTCALRFSGVYGPEEQKIMPKVCSWVKSGILIFGFGSPSQFLSGENSAQSMYLAYRSLTPYKKRIAAGQAYFISDGPPVHSYEFFRPLHELYCTPFPKYMLPFWLIYGIAWFLEMIYVFLGPFEKYLGFVPLITRAEVNQMAVTHYFSIEKARNHLGYRPKNANDLTGVVDHYRKKLKNDCIQKAGTNHQIIGSMKYAFVLFCILSVVLLYYCLTYRNY